MQSDLAMSDFVEVITIRTMMAKVINNGLIVEEYKVEQCDRCQLIRKLDQFGYVIVEGEKTRWLCGNCR
jgi:hypothetical protein